MGLYEKIYNVMNESSALSKDMTVGGQYQAISEKAVLNEIKPLLKKHKLILFPIGAEVNQEGKLTQLTAKYKIVDIESGEFEVLETVGNGSDSQDKGSGKAWTYAYKCLIQKTFCLFSGEDTDNTHSDDIEKPVNRKLSDGQVKRLFAIAKSAGIDAKQVKADVLKSTKKVNVEDMTKAEYDRACKHYEGMKG